MTRTIATALIAVATLAAPAAFAGENAVRDSQTKIDRALGKVDTQPTATGQVSASREGTGTTFLGLEVFLDTQWQDNYRAGRVHPPAGR